MEQRNNQNITNSNFHSEHLICWRSAFAGLVLAAITFTGVTGLALAFGGAGLSDGTTGTAVGVFSGVSFTVAIVLSTLVGAFFAVRVRRHGARSCAYSQSLLVGSLVVLFVIAHAAAALGVAGKAAGGILGATFFAAGAGAASATQSPMLQEIVEDNLGALNLKSTPEVVLRGVTSRLINGNEKGAKNYLAAQAGLTPEEADQKIALARTNLNRVLVETRETAATALKATGWSLFTVVVLGLMASLLGGFLAAKYAWHPHREPEMRKGGTLTHPV